MRSTIETKFTKMLSVRLDKEVYSQLERELQLQINPKTRLGCSWSLTSLVRELLKDGLEERQRIRQQNLRM